MPEPKKTFHDNTKFIETKYKEGKPTETKVIFEKDLDQPIFTSEAYLMNHLSDIRSEISYLASDNISIDTASNYEVDRDRDQREIIYDNIHALEKKSNSLLNFDNTSSEIERLKLKDDLHHKRWIEGVGSRERRRNRNTRFINNDLSQAEFLGKPGNTILEDVERQKIIAEDLAVLREKLNPREQ